MAKRIGSHQVRRLFGVAVLLVLALTGILLITSSVTDSTPNPLNQAALRYANQQMIWTSGPTVRRSDTLPLGRLSHALATEVSPTVAAHVNVSDLLHRFSANRRIALVILTGSFNSLPPDEGVDMHGDVVVLLDAQNNKPLFLTD